MKRHSPKLSDQRIKRGIRIRSEAIDAMLAMEAPNVASLTGLIQDGVGLAQYAAAADPDDPVIERGLAAAAWGGSALFVGLIASDTVKVDGLDGRPRVIPALSPSSSTSPADWLNAYHCAMCVGDHNALGRLAATEPDLLRQSPSKVEEFGYLHIAALAAYHRHDPDTPQRTLQALKATDPDRLDKDMQDYALRIAVPQIDLLFRVVERDELAFNSALAKALEQHRKYYASDSAPILGQLALGLLAMACTAHDRGMAVEVDSEYLPAWIINTTRAVAPVRSK